MPIQPPRPAARLALAIAVLVLLPLAVGTVRAQAFEPAVTVQALTDARSLSDGDTADVSWSVTNTGMLDATVDANLRVPTGWTAALAAADASFPLAPGASRTIQVTLTPGDAPQPGALALFATASDGAGRTSPTASATVPVTYVPPPPPPPPRDYTAEIVASALGSLALVGLATAAAVYVARARRLALYVDPVQRPVTSGTDGIFLVQVENLGKVRREVELRVQGLPAAWHGAFSFPRVQLVAGERGPVPLCIKVPFTARDGLAADVRLSARPSRRFPWLVHATTRIEAHDRVVIGPGRTEAVAPAASAAPAAPLGDGSAAEGSAPGDGTRPAVDGKRDGAKPRRVRTAT